MEELFDKFVKHSVKDGIHEYTCRRGLWSVSCSRDEVAKNEAMNYFYLYAADGEYDQECIYAAAKY